MDYPILWPRDRYGNNPMVASLLLSRSFSLAAPRARCRRYIQYFAAELSRGHCTRTPWASVRPQCLVRDSARSFGKKIANTADFGADGFQFFFDVLVTAIEVVDAVDDGLSVGDEGGEHKRSGGAQV